MTKAISQAELDIIYGPEPTFDTDKEPSESELYESFKWYRETQSDAIKKKWFLEFAERELSEEDVTQLKTVPDYRFCTVGTWARMVKNGANFSDKQHKHFLELSANLNEYVDHDQLKSKKNNPKKVSVQEHITNSVNNYVGDIEFEIDKFIANGFESDFSMLEFLEKNEIKGLIAKRIGESLVPQQKELQELIADWDIAFDLRESWSQFTKTQIKLFDKFISSMIEDCNTLSENKKRSAKPRKHKSIDINKIIAKVQYLKHDSKLKLESLHPSKIVKADEVWVWNQKLRKLGVYRSKSTNGLTIKGTTIQDFDETSVSKTIRNPKEYFEKIMSGGKRVMKKTFGEVKAKEQKLNGRLNKDTLIVKVF